MKSVLNALNLNAMLKLPVIILCIVITYTYTNAQPYTLTVSKNGTGGGNVTTLPAGIDCGSTCSANFPSGLTVTIVATPDASSTFSGWSGAATGMNTVQTVTMDGNKSVSALFTRSSYTLNVTRSGSGSGTISSSPSGISCGITCSASYSAGSSITLTATPDEGSVFTGWTGGGCSGTGTCVVSMSSGISVEASFTYASVDYYADTDGDGYGAGDVIHSETQPPNTSINNLDCDDTDPLVHPGATEICGNSTDEDCSGVLDDCSKYSFTVSKSGTGGGTISTSPAGIDCGSTCSALFPAGSSVTITATPDATSSFAGWSGALTGTDPAHTIIMDGAKAVSAVFTRNLYPLNVSKTGNGTGTITSSPAGINCGGDCSANYVAGSSITLTATPGAGSVFTGWTGGGCTGTGTCDVSMMSENTVSASFCLLPEIPQAISGDPLVCFGTPQNYSIAEVPDAAGYSWTMPSGWTGTSTTNSITAKAGNTGEISVYAMNSCGSGPARTLYVTVNSAPHPVTLSASEDSICENGAVQLSLENSQTGISYQMLNQGNNSGNPQTGNGSTLTFNSGILTSTGLFSIKAEDIVSSCSKIFDTVRVHVNPVYSFQERDTICSGETFHWHGTDYSATGTYTAAYTTIHGCDSIYTLQLIVNRGYEFNQEYTMCEGETYTWQGNEYSRAGTYSAIYPSIHGCDSIYRLNLVVNPAYAFSQIYKMNDGETYTWQGHEYSGAGIYTAAYSTIHGCDSIYTLRLVVDPVYEISQEYQMCEGEIYTWQGNEYSVGGTYTAAYTTINGGDSIYTLNLVVHPVFSFSENHEICEGENFNWHGRLYNEAGTYTVAFMTVYGCDSIYTLNLTLKKVDVTVTVAGSVITANLEGATYRWLNCDNSFETLDGETSRSFSAPSEGYYAVEVTQGSCTDTSECIPVSPLETPALQKEDISVYPNPVTGKLFISVTGNSEIKDFEILNPFGQVIFSDDIMGTTVVETSRFEPGIYFIRFKCKTAFGIKKIVIE